MVGGILTNLFSVSAACLFLVFSGVSTQAAPATAIPNSACLDCHSDKTLNKTNAAGREISLFVDPARLGASVHKTNTCWSCHSDIGPKHPDDNLAVKPVDCAKCHQKQSESYGASVHGQAFAQGRRNSATCSDCHDGHTITPPTSPDSPLHFSHLAKTCGACHEQAAKDVAQSVHGKALAAGHRDAPTCTDCHSEHRIVALKGSSPVKISVDVCGNCHASERLNTKYNLPSDRVKTFFDSYHGLASQYGSTLAANCSSCHGVHKILSSSDPNSTINAAHLVETCGKCHPGATENFASSRVHIDAAMAARGDGIGQIVNYWVRRLYLGLIIAVIGGMALHNGMMFIKKVRARLRAADFSVVRMSLAQRWQHALLAISFTVLAITGFALKFPDSWLAKLMGSSEPIRSWTHRIAGIVMLGVGACHIVYLMRTEEGRRLWRDLLPVKKDLRDVVQTVVYLAGRRESKPKIARFGYAEKMEYWAVIWGTIIMGATGFMVWFKMDVTRFMPRWVVDIGLTIHYYEAILACLAILVWHFYHVIFDPDVYPANAACWNGRVSKHWQMEEHALECANAGETSQEIVAAKPAVDVAPAVGVSAPRDSSTGAGAHNGNGHVRDG